MTIDYCPIHGNCNHKYYSNGKGRPKRLRCIACLRDRQNSVRLTKKQRLIEALGGQCVLCGYHRHPGSLEFHHLDPKIKEHELSRLLLSRSYDLCLAEAQKCVLLCRNCHGEIETGYLPTIQKLQSLM